MRSKSLKPVPASVLKIWNENIEKGFISQIERDTGLTKPTTIKAIKHGVASKNTVLIISKWFAENASKTTESLALQILEPLNK